MNIDYFPAKIARAPRFCNRTQERALLSSQINLGRHTVLVSPRRYGKSSLVYQVVQDLQVPCAFVDLFLAHDGNAVTKRILSGISQVISHIMPLSQKALNTAQSFFTRFKVVLETGGFGLQFIHESIGFDPVEQIYNALESLAKLAKSQNKLVVLFIDEFQDIANADNARSIQGAIRHVAQDASNLIFIFSGSNRQLLLQLFDDKNKPFYMLCDKLFLDRMSSVDYKPYIQEAAQATWGEWLEDAVIEKILVLTELHPFYVNLLCHEVWKQKEVMKLPTVEDVIHAWISCYETERRRLISELEHLTKNQQDILKSIAQQSVEEPSSQKFLLQVGLPLSSVRSGIKTLIEKDLLYKVKDEDESIPNLKKGQYRVLDPLLAYALRKYS